MVTGDIGAAAARERMADLRRQAEHARLVRLARSRRQAAEIPGRGGTTMLVEHQHRPGMFDPGHCRDCARESDLLDHDHHVQREEQALKEAHRWARQARSYAVRALWSAGIGLLLATIALLTG